MNCTRCGKEVKTLQKNLSTAKAREIWATVEKAAESCPEWMQEKIRKAARSNAKKIAENPVCGTCEYKENYG